MFCCYALKVHRLIGLNQTNLILKTSVTNWLFSGLLVLYYCLLTMPETSYFLLHNNPSRPLNWHEAWFPWKRFLALSWLLSKHQFPFLCSHGSTFSSVSPFRSLLKLIQTTIKFPPHQQLSKHKIIFILLVNFSFVSLMVLFIILLMCLHCITCLYSKHPFQPRLMRCRFSYIQALWKRRRRLKKSTVSLKKGGLYTISVDIIPDVAQVD